MLFGFISTVYAQGVSSCDPGAGGINLGNCLKLSDSSKVSDVYRNPATLVNLLVNNLFVLAGIMFFIFLIVAGFKFITGGKKGAEEAQGIVQTSLTGFIIMFSAYWIMQIIALLTGIDIPGVSN